MNIETLQKYCLSKKGTSEDMPFDEETIVYRVGGKIFLLTGLENIPLRFNAKCDPEKAIELREQYPDNILPGYHMNKKHWNTLICDGTISDDLIRELIDHSYELVYSSLKKSVKAEIEER